jgi:2,4-dienoyl-CoA reductase-like NADH-dependent reductase (Old Yellow Enzyme family)
MNPQDYNYTDNTMELSTLFSEWQLGKLTIPNRMVKSAAGSSTAPNGMEATIEFYSNIAKGGIGMLWVENFTSLMPDYLNADKADIDDWGIGKLVDAVHAEGASIGYQFETMAMTLLDGYSGTEGFGPAHPENLELKEVKWLIEQYIKSAKRLKDYGFDGFEINAAGNNIPRTFMSRATNLRPADDEYGPQTLESRSRFVVEIIKGIKKECGEDFIVQILINGIEENDEQLGQNYLCTTIEENKQFAKMFEEAGADSLHVRLGPLANHTAQFMSEVMFDGIGIEGSTSFGTQYDYSKHFEGKLIANHSGCGLMLDVAAEIKSAVSIPVGTVTYMDPAHAPDFFEQALEDGKVDFLMMNRSLSVEPEYATKLQEGRIDEIRPCTRCLHCLRDMTMDGEMSMRCRVDATKCRAYSEEMPEGFTPVAVDEPKKVMVIGGGPAGMEAARIAAQRGHEVTLFEKSQALGGKLDFANAVKGPHQNLAVLQQWMQHQLELLGVTIATDTEVTADLIASEAPDAVICATGGKRPEIALQATDATQVMGIDECLEATVGDNVVVMGGNEQAFDIAQYFQVQGKNITMVFPDDIVMFDKGQSSQVQGYVLPMYYSVGGRAFPMAEVTTVGDGEIIIKTSACTEMPIACDTLIDASDVLDNTDLVKDLNGIDVIAVGDCNKPWETAMANIQHAIAEGNLAGRAV